MSDAHLPLRALQMRGELSQYDRELFYQKPKAPLRPKKTYWYFKNNLMLITKYLVMCLIKTQMREIKRAIALVQQIFQTLRKIILLLAFFMVIGVYLRYSNQYS